MDYDEDDTYTYSNYWKQPYIELKEDEEEKTQESPKIFSMYNNPAISVYLETLNDSPQNETNQFEGGEEKIQDLEQYEDEVIESTEPERKEYLTNLIKSPSSLNLIDEEKKVETPPEELYIEGMTSSEDETDINKFYENIIRSEPDLLNDKTRPIQDVSPPEVHRLTKADLFFSEDNDSILPNIDILKDHLFKEGKLTEQCAIFLLKKVRKILKQEGNVLNLEAPLVIYGDIHGQYYDLLNLLDNSGDPKNTKYLFLGDYVDRGLFGTEVCFLLFCLKICYPKSIFLIRGNHECRLLTSHFNFKTECLSKYDIKVYDYFMKVFDCLPISAIVTNNEGKYFCCHGGLSPSINDINSIESINRFEEPPKVGAFCDLLWSDPLEEDTADGLSPTDMKEWYAVDYVENPTRGCGFVFGHKACKKFLEDNDFISIIRAHEVQKEGYFEHPMQDKSRKSPMVITVFSAPNYCDMYENEGAYMVLEENGYKFEKKKWVNHPAGLPKFTNAVKYSFNFILAHLEDFITILLEKYPNVEEESIEEIEEPKVESVPVLKRPRAGSLRQLRIDANKLKEIRAKKEAKKYVPLSASSGHESADVLQGTGTVSELVGNYKRWSKFKINKAIEAEHIKTHLDNLAGTFGLKLTAYNKTAQNTAFENALYLDRKYERIPNAEGNENLLFRDHDFSDVSGFWKELTDSGTLKIPTPWNCK